ncbi:MAG TPA: ABC transporter transmembrane domain-containing protein [Pyrinomonadaceae bacterium]|nr:ABC transporter transmembrane domain-containing protein [Pyrinomonadaceae bacterium]
MKDFKRLLKYLRPHLFTFIAAVVAMIFVALFETALGALITPIFNLAFNFGQTVTSTTPFNLQSLIPQDDWYKAWMTISALLLAFTVFGGIAEYFSSYLMAKIGQSAILELRQELYSHLLKQPAAFFQKHRTNFLVARLVTSAAAIEYAVAGNLRDVLRESFNLVFFLSAAFFYNWRLMLGVFANKSHAL